jgi:hypothetical protein
MAKICPCKGCVPPKRNAECHSNCKEYKDWVIECQEDLVKIKEIQRVEDDCFPNRLRKKGKMI